MSIQAVIEAIDAMEQLHRSLIELGEMKGQVIIRNQVDELNRIVGKESRLVKQIDELERQRIEAVSSFLQSKGYNASADITVSELSRIVFQAEEKQRLHDAQHRLLRTIAKLKKLNELNQQMIQQSLAYIDFTLDLYAGAPEQEAFYQNPAKQSYGMKPRGFFDARS